MDLSQINRKKLAFKIKRPNLDIFYRRILGNHWLADAVSYLKERDGYKSLPKEIRKVIKEIVTFFATADGIVIENLINGIKAAFGHIPECKNMFAQQEAQEIIHSETYALLYKAIFPDREKQKKIELASVFNETISKLHDWAIEYSKKSLMERLVAFSCFEGIIFVSSFAYIYLIKNLCSGETMTALTTTNEWIARDESLHAEFAIELYKTVTRGKDKMVEPLSEERLHTIIKESVELAIEFSNSCLPNDITGMKKADMANHIRHVADIIAEGYECSKIYNVMTPFLWMSTINIRNKTNFFEHHSTDYTRNMKRKIDWNDDSY